MKLIKHLLSNPENKCLKVHYGDSTLYVTDEQAIDYELESFVVTKKDKTYYVPFSAVNKIEPLSEVPETGLNFLK